MRITSIFVAALCAASILVGLALTGANLYGLGQSLRPPGLGEDARELRFIPEEVWPFERSMREIEALADISEVNQIALRANFVANRSLVHIDWERVDPVKYRQLVPLWENFGLHILGRVTSMPQIQRYHFADYKRSIERGIGICGDAANLLSSILDRYGVENRIVSFPGHVVVEYEDADKSLLLDPDFGIALEMSVDELKANPAAITDVYRQNGYSDREINRLIEVYGRGPSFFDDTFHFMTKRYVFEELSYLAKWPLPIMMVLIPGLVLRRTIRRTGGPTFRSQLEEW